MTNHRDELWDRLRTASIVQGPSAPIRSTESPWFVRAMIGAAAWIGALFLFGFLGIALQSALREPGACFLFGAMCCAAGTTLLFFRSGDFLIQFGFAISLAGQGLILMGFGEQHAMKAHDIAFAMAVVEVMLFLAIANFSHRVWSAAIAAWAFSFGMLDTGLWPAVPAIVGASCAYCWLQEFSHARLVRIYSAAGYGLTVGLLGWLISQASFEMLLGDVWHPAKTLVAAEWVGGLASGAVLIWVLASLLRRGDQGPVPRALVAFASVGLLIVSVRAPGLGPAVAVIVLAFANGNRVLLGLAIVGLFAYLAQYYYWVQITLLAKSIVLIALGLGLLAIRHSMSLWWPTSGAVAHERAN